MDHIDEHLATAATDNNYSLAIKAALAIGKKTLNRYYDKTDQSEVFRIAMGMIFLTDLLYIFILSSSTNFLVLHPRHKLHYFKNEGWQDNWIERAEEIIRTQFDLSYGSLDTSWASRQTQAGKAKVCTRRFHCKLQSYRCFPRRTNHPLQFQRTCSTISPRFKHQNRRSCVVS
jgi:hypothetical protein